MNQASVSIQRSRWRSLVAQRLSGTYASIHSCWCSGMNIRRRR